MPADFFSRLPVSDNHMASIAAFDPVHTNLKELHLQDKALQILQNFLKTCKWSANL
jgi:hypothetical protein